ncbi:MAG: ABC transporter permease [Ignavibacteriaceae bacterium]|nr:ABC transporter permease [Ignavibacteriaceae bacterium]
MKKILAIAKWEFIEKVKTKTFIISLILTPIIIIGFSIVPTLLSTKEDTRTKAIGVFDRTGYYFDYVQEELVEFKLEDGQPNYIIINLYKEKEDPAENKASADKNIIQKIIEGYLFINMPSPDSLLVEYRSGSIGNFRDLKRFEDVLNKIRIHKELLNSGIDPEMISSLQKNIKIEQIRIEESGKEGKQDFLIVFFSSFIFIILLMMMVIYSGQMLVRSLIEEKSNKLIEVLISSCTPDELLTGKILGLSSLGLTQIFVWVLLGLGLVGGAVVPPEMFENILLILLFFVLGFVFYTTLFVGIGSIVTTEQEAQQITTYLSLTLMLPIVIAMPAIQNPDVLILRVFSYIPLTIPSVMLLRVNIAPVPVVDLLITISIMLTSIFIMIKLSAKIFRIGILSYGGRPTIKEIISWIKSG